MKKIFLNAKYIVGVLGSALLLSTTSIFVGCKEEIDESNFAIKSEQTAADFIDADPNFSMIKSVFTRVKLTKDTLNAATQDKISSIYSALTARGNYTVFLPTNDAVTSFVQSKGVASVDELTYEDAKLIAMSCILDHQNNSAYETADFPTTGSFALPNLYDRLLSCQLDDDTRFIINGTSKVIDEDNEVSNGFVHVVDAVVAPSALTLDKLIGKASNLKVFSYLLKKTSWADSLYRNLDLSYEDPTRPLIYNLNNVAPFEYARHRYDGYTAFVEPDSVYEKFLGVKVQLVKDRLGNDSLANADDFVTALINKIGSEEYYKTATSQDFTSTDNVVNRFVAYHLLNGKMSFNKLNHHYNEYGYKYGDANNPQRVNMPTNVWDYYTTMGQTKPVYPKNTTALLKVVQVGDASEVEPNKQSHPVYLNRVSTYKNGPEEDYKEIGTLNKGILVSATNGADDNNALNGYYFTINELLVYSDNVRKLMQNERIRIDVTTMLPELLSNNIRGTVYTRFENGYFTNITRESPDTKLLYLMPQGSNNWRDYQGDEFMVSGLYDFTMKLPPVPKFGTYEIRMGVSQNSLRGMSQIYFGKDDPLQLTPTGLPYDMRQPAEPSNPALPWDEDTEDWEVNFELDKKLRNQGYMKGPQYFTIGDGKAEQAARSFGKDANCIRKIVTVAEMDPEHTYYIRFKSALKKTDSQFFMDYFEYASTNVYNGATAEDIW